MSDPRDETQITDEVLEQLEEVRQTGLTNMMDLKGVLQVAEAMDLTALVAFATAVDGMSRWQRGSRWMTALEHMGGTRAGPRG